MKILLVNQVFWPDVVATAQYLTDLALELKKAGHEVTVLASRIGYADPHFRYPATEDYQGIHIIRVWPFTLGKKSKAGRIIDALCLDLALFLRLLWMPRFDVVAALTSPPFVAAFACFAAKFRKSRFVYWVMDMNPDEAIAMGWVKEKAVVTQILKKIAFWTFCGSDRIVVLDRYMKQRILAKGVQERKIHVIPPWPHDKDLQLIPHEENLFRRRYALENKFVVMYSGNHSICHPLETLLEAAKFLKNDLGVMFVFIGGGVRTEDVRLFKEKFHLDNILQIGYQPRSEIRYSLSAADLHAVVMGNNMVGIVHPCKVYGILMLGRPILYIGPPQSHIGGLMAMGACEYAVKHGEITKLLESIQCSRSLRKDQLENMMQKNRGIAQHFSSDRLISEMIEILTSFPKENH